MIDRRIDAELSQKSDAAHAEDFFLDDARLGIAAVEMPGNEAVDLAVAAEIGVEQIQRNAADPCQPRLSENLASADLYRDHDAFAGRVEHRRQSQFRFENVVIRFLLPALVADLLAKIPVAVQQPDRHQRHVKVARRFEMVAGQYAETARVVGQGIMHAVLSTEIGDRRRRCQVACGGGVITKFAVKPLDAADVRLISGTLPQPKAADTLEHQTRILLALVPQFGVEVAKECNALGTPTPIKVGRYLV